jgi:hypothetical protein
MESFSHLLHTKDLGLPDINKTPFTFWIEFIAWQTKYMDDLEQRQCIQNIYSDLSWRKINAEAIKKFIKTLGFKTSNINKAFFSWEAKA